MVAFRCRGGAFVDKQEYQDAKVVACPLPRCNYVWCRSCSQTIDFAGPPHSCDGSSELNHLMSLRGWKHCPGNSHTKSLLSLADHTILTPGCKTPTEKTDGCNHMTVSYELRL
jgi:hypothetical protein